MKGDLKKGFGDGEQRAGGLAGPGADGVSRDFFVAFLRRNAWRYGAGVAALVAIDALQLVVPRVLGSLADLYSEGRLTAADAGTAAAQLVGLGVFIGLGRWAWRHFLLGASRHLEAELRRHLFMHLQRMSATYFARRRVGDLMAHLTNDVQAVRMAAGQGVVILVDAVFMTTAVAAVMAFSVDARLFVLAAGPLLVAAAGLVALGRKVHRRFREVQEGFSRLCEFVEENVSGIRVVKGFGREDVQCARFDELAHEQLGRQMRLTRVWALMTPVSETAVGLAFAALLGVGGAMVLQGVVRLGDFVAFTSYIGLLVWPLTAVGWLINMIQRGRASMERLQALLREPPDVPEPPSPVRLARRTPTIEVRHLTFTYPGARTPDLVDVSFVVRPGETVGVVGPSGSGKTTLVMLLLRLLDPPDGTIFIDGHDIRTIALEDWREQVGYVPQDPFLFSETLADNIAFGLNGDAARDSIGAVDAIVQRAARLAHLDEDVQTFAQGYASLVGERGLALSGGQKQRAALARAVAKDPGVLLLDDALSSVDVQTEQAILRDLYGLLAGRSALVVAHRVSVVKGARRILVLDRGRLVEQGSHEELLGRDGLYARLYRLQLLESELVNM